MDFIARSGQTFLNLVRQFSLKDAIDVAIVTVLLYGIIKLVRDTQASQLIKGVFLLIALILISHYGNLMVLNGILNSFLESAFVIVVILFQPEIRKALEQVGRSKVGRSLASAVGVMDKEAGSAATHQAIVGVVEATAILQQLRMGALIIFERSARLGEIIATGTLVDAGPAGQLIANIFFNKAPLHDGGMVIRDGRICAAGCILPLTSSDAVSAELGTRHRAAIGMSENSDAVVVVVSEETGQISIAIDGRLTRNYNRVSLLEELEKQLISQPEPEQGGSRLLDRLGLNKNSK